ncbi:Fic family protein [Nocardioides jejuensis]|uniref:Fic family protein n=1 Tax=Nocardioides jejuensis TaxID=2502782 RepID=A0A4R1BX41_9ACTN|nr:Fic family protein [Nocardioides jejuensis]TCJ22589.1 Fic family protein [Nocardioides jejuensis]
MSSPDVTDWPPHTHEVRPWRQAAPRGPRKDRLVRDITVALPPKIARLTFEPEPALLRMLEAVAGGLTHLDMVHGRTLAALNGLLLRTESVDSSKIENVDASLADYGKALLGEGANSSAMSMASATSALARMIREAGQLPRTVSKEAMLQAHHDLFSRVPGDNVRPGHVRHRQNWVGGSDYSPLGALHVPPPPETVHEYLDDLFVFANRDDMPALAQAAIVHAQFESIHPFTDGNGRIGRALIHAVLRKRRVTRHLTVPIASGLVSHRDQYFQALNDYRAGNASTIVTMLASAASIATRESRQTATDIVEIRERWQAALGRPYAGTPAYRLLDLVIEEPMINLPLVGDRLTIDEPAAKAVVAEAVEADVLTRAKGSRRTPVWLARDVLHEVHDLSVRISEKALTLHAED